MTTDTLPKAVSSRLTIDDKPVSITGIAKGSGMIHPDMATMLAFLLTDADLEMDLRLLLQAASERSRRRSGAITAAPRGGCAP